MKNINILSKFILLPKFMFIFTMFCVLLLASCNEDGGNVYNHLKNQEAGNLHKTGLFNNEDDAGNATQEGVYDHMNDNLCNINPHCCNDFSIEEENFAELETRAVVEKDATLCLSLPDEPLIVSCPYEEDYIYYSKRKCLADIATITSCEQFELLELSAVGIEIEIVCVVED